VLRVFVLLLSAAALRFAPLESRFIPNADSSNLLDNNEHDFDDVCGHEASAWERRGGGKVRREGEKATP